MLIDAFIDVCISMYMIMHNYIRIDVSLTGARTAGIARLGAAGRSVGQSGLRLT